MNIKNKFNNLIKNKNFKYGTISTALTIVFISIILLLNIILGALSNRVTLSWDLTKNKAFSLTEQSKDFIKNIDKEVEIIILNKESDFSSYNEYFIQANSVLKQYAKTSDKIKLSYIDVVKNPTYLQANFPNEDLNTNSIIVKCGNKYKVITINDIFDISYGYYGNQSITASKAEQELTSAIIYVTSENQIKVTFLKGYSEADFYDFSELLKKNNYNVVETALLTEDIQEDSSAVIIFAPERDYDNRGIEKLEKYLTNSDKTLIYIANPKLNDFPNISKLIEKYDIKINSGIVYETNTSKLTSSMNLFEAICDYVNEEFTQNLKSPEIPVLLPACKPLEAINKDTTFILLQFSETSGIMPLNANNSFDFKSNISGPIPCSILSKKDNKNILVVSSYIGLTGQYLSATSLNNSSYFINIINTLLNKKDASLIIESKSIINEELGINAMQANVIGIIYTLLVPAIVLIIGIIVFMKRKNK